MNTTAKRVLNILSYCLNLFFIGIILYGLIAGKKTTEDNAINKEDYLKQCIVEREKADLPLKIQQFDKVYGITIDSLVLTNNVEPYSGYLITTWDLDEKQDLTTNQWVANGYKDKYIRKQKQVFVELNTITLDKDGMTSWYSNWPSAYYSVKNQ